MRKQSEAALADRHLLGSRLRSAGLAGAVIVEVHENASVMVSRTRTGALRVHRGYAYASDHVLEAIVRYITPGAGRVGVKEAENILLSFRVHDYVPPKKIHMRKSRLKTGDRTYIRKLRKLHQALNELHFKTKLSHVPISVSHRMRIRLGEITIADCEPKVVQISLSRAHLERDPWKEVECTLLHEMVHQWQVETGLEADHGREFREMARRVGIQPAATRDVAAVVSHNRLKVNS